MPRISLYSLTSSPTSSPSLGAEIVLNGGFEVDATSWSANNGATLTGGTASGYSGNCLQVTRGTAQNCGSQSPTTTSGTWYYVNLWGKDGTGTARARVQGKTPLFSFGANWTNNLASFRSTAASEEFRLEISTANGTTGLYDELSLKPLTLSSLFSNTYSLSPALSSIKVNVTIPNYCQAGIVRNLDSTGSPANFILGYYNNSDGKAYLDKCVAGTYTNLIATTTTYAAGAILEVKRTADFTYQLFYNGSQVGTDQTIGDFAIYQGKIHGLFSTDSANSFSNLILTYPSRTAA